MKVILLLAPVNLHSVQLANSVDQNFLLVYSCCPSVLPTLHFLVQGPKMCPFLPHIRIVTVQNIYVPVAHWVWGGG